RGSKGGERWSCCAPTKRAGGGRGLPASQGGTVSVGRWVRGSGQRRGEGPATPGRRRGRPPWARSRRRQPTTRREVGSRARRAERVDQFLVAHAIPDGS